MGNTTQGFDKLLEDITKLEINTIVKDNMTARKMPDPANAILDVAQTYGWYLAKRGVPVARWFDDDSPVAHWFDEGGSTEDENEKIDADLQAALGELKSQGRLGEWIGPLSERHSGKFASAIVRVDFATFAVLRCVAVAALAHGGPSAAEQVVLTRIRRNCDQIKNLFDRLKSVPEFEGVKGKNRAEVNTPTQSDYRQRKLIRLAPDDASLLRKIWEIGVEDVVAQATIQLDGDVVNRISRDCVGPEHGPLLEVHRLGIRTSVDFWSSLMGAVGGFISDLAGLVTGARR